MLAELQRTARRFGVRPDDLLPRAVYRYNLALDACLDLRNQANRAVLGLSREAMRDDDLTPCQQVAMAAHYLGFEAVLAPSATSAGPTVAVFIDRLQATSRLEPGEHEILTTLPRS